MDHHCNCNQLLLYIWYIWWLHNWGHVEFNMFSCAAMMLLRWTVSKMGEFKDSRQCTVWRIRASLYKVNRNDDDGLEYIILFISIFLAKLLGFLKVLVIFYCHRIYTLVISIAFVKSRLTWWVQRVPAIWVFRLL